MPKALPWPEVGDTQLSNAGGADQDCIRDIGFPIPRVMQSVQTSNSTGGDSERPLARFAKR